MTPAIRKANVSDVAAEQDVITAATRLDPATRGRLAELLWASLDADATAPAVSEEWSATLRRRLAEVDAGTAPLTSADEVFRRLRVGRER